MKQVADLPMTIIIKKVFGKSKKKCNSAEMREVWKREDDSTTKGMMRLREGNRREVE